MYAEIYMHRHTHTHTHTHTHRDTHTSGLCMQSCHTSVLGRTAGEMSTLALISVCQVPSPSLSILSLSLSPPFSFSLIRRQDKRQTTPGASSIDRLGKKKPNGSRESNNTSVDLPSDEADRCSSSSITRLLPERGRGRGEGRGG